MGFKKDKKYNSDEIIHVAVLTTKELIKLLDMDLFDYFMEHKVFLVAVKEVEIYGPDSVTFILAGKEKDIIRSVKKLRKIGELKELGLETSPMKCIPLSLQGYLNDLEDSEKYNKLLSYCVEEYIDDCVKNNVDPHPEILEEIIKN